MKKSDLILVIIFVLIGVLTRTIFHVGHNVEFITATSIVSGYFLSNKRLSFLVTLSSLIISDLILGNTIIFLFTWSGFIFGNLMGLLVSREKRFLSALIYSQALGLVSTIFFFLWTNLGVVLTSNLYQKTWEGLLQSYINALPFLRPQLIGNLLIVPIIFVAVSVCTQRFELSKPALKKF